jgi:hypothetical protein
MRVRHKVPAIFSLSMVDMLCCALGCVILVWLLNAKQADDDAAERREEIHLLTQKAEAEREESSRLLSDARSEHDRATRRVRALTGERDRAVSEIGDLKKRLSSTEAAAAGLRKDLGDERGKAKDLAGKLQRAGDRVASLEGDVAAGKSMLEKEREKAAGLAKQVGERDDTLKGARADLTKREASLKSLQADLAAAKEKAEAALAARDKELAAAREKLAAMSKVVSDRQAALAAADAKLAKSEKQREILTSAVEGRFAGIELTGERVVFLVDMSGSMEQLDENTPSPEKWAEVRQTLARVMRSLPKLEKFQLITFGPKHDYPLGSPGKWLAVDPKTSPDAAAKALAEIKPRGGTNMYVAMDEAFRFRPLGLDTIYLMSDGLPNQGEGLTPAQQATLKGIDRGVALGKHVRSTLKTTWNKPAGGRRVKIHTVGFFYESPDLGSFLWALARENDGSFVGMNRP